MSSINILDLIETKLHNPCATLQQLSDKYGVTRERIRQLLEPYELPTGKHMRGVYNTTCPNCGGKKGDNVKICSKCLKEQMYIFIACDTCGRLKKYNTKWLIWEIAHGRHSTDHFFCGKQCQGKWLGKNYGNGKLNK